MERECDVSVLIKQICTGSDVMSQCSMSLWYDRSVAAHDGTLHETDRNIAGVAGVSSERGISDSEKMSDSDCSSVQFLLNEGMSDGDHRGSVAKQQDCRYLETVDGRNES